MDPASGWQWPVQARYARTPCAAASTANSTASPPKSRNTQMANARAPTRVPDGLLSVRRPLSQCLRHGAGAGARSAARGGDGVRLRRALAPPVREARLVEDLGAVEIVLDREQKGRLLGDLGQRRLRHVVQLAVVGELEQERAEAARLRHRGHAQDEVAHDLVLRDGLEGLEV